MFLGYGIDSNDNLIYIEQVGRGKTELKCPYCGGFLTAKKGNKKEHHFAHTEETCVATSQERTFYLPLFDKFHLSLSAQEYNALLLWHGGTRISKKMFFRLAEKGIFSSRGYGYSLTKLGKIACGDLSIFLFSQIQENLIIEKYQKLKDDVQVAYQQNVSNKNDLLRDFQIYREQAKRVLNQSLYLLRVIVNNAAIYKIGVTTKVIEEPISDLEQELKTLFGSVSIELLGSWQHWGSLKRYFIYKYQNYLCQYNEYKEKEYRLSSQIGGSNNHFTFSSELIKKVLRDLRRIPDKLLSNIEQEIVNENLSSIELVFPEQQQHSVAIKIGMQQAKDLGVHIGRPKGETESIKQFLAKPKNQAIAAVLKKGLSLRQAAKETGASVNTIRKVKAALDKELRSKRS